MLSGSVVTTTLSVATVPFTSLMVSRKVYELTAVDDGTTNVGLAVEELASVTGEPAVWVHEWLDANWNAVPSSVTEDVGTTPPRWGPASATGGAAASRTV